MTIFFGCSSIDSEDFEDQNYETPAHPGIVTSVIFRHLWVQYNFQIAM